MTVDGVAMTSASNTVSNAIPGVTFQLLSTSAAPTAPVQVEITNDNSDIESAMSSLVTAYNAVVSDMNGQEANDSSGNPEPFYGNPTLAMIAEPGYRERCFAGSERGDQQHNSAGDWRSTMMVRLTLNTDTLDSALNANFSDVTGFLQNSGSFGQALAGR